MAIISATVADAEFQRVVDAFAGAFSYSPTLPNGDPNPQTKVQFFRAKVLQLIKDVVVRYEARVAAEDAKATAEASASMISIT